MNKEEYPKVSSVGGRIIRGYGDGQNGVYLSESGLNIISVDLSSVGFSKAYQLAEIREYRSNLFVLSQPTIKSSLVR